MRGLYNAAGSMLVNQVRLENLGNNMANLDTPGYKRSEVVTRTFPEMLIYRLESSSRTGPVVHSPVGLGALNVAVEETHILYGPGALRSTGRELDLALQEPGFFVVETPDGMRYTRDGHFHVSEEGTLVNSQGHPVWGEDGPVVLESDRPVVDAEGNVAEAGDYVDRLQVVFFEAEELLWKEGYNLFEAEPDAVPELVEMPRVFQGYLEDSNADLSRQMTELVKVRRCYEAARKISQTYDSLLSRAANELGSLR